ncbi:MAG: FAD-dependent oxidoreductase [Pseudomonadota bacterium]
MANRGNGVDVIVVGAGIMGLWCAWAALDRGLTVRVLDRAGPGAGASGGVIGALSPHTPDRWNPKKQFQVEALLALGPALARVEAASGLSAGYGRVGRLQPVRDARGAELARERVAGAAAFWGDAARLALLGPETCTGWADPDAAPEGWLHDTLSARLDPRATCRALAAGITARGGAVETGDVVAVGPGRVETASARSDAGAVIVAGGVAAFDLLAPHLGEVAGRGEKGQALVVAGRMPPDTPILYGNGTYVIAHAAGGIAVGATSERVYDDPLAVDGLLEEALDRARALCPVIREAPVLRRWAGVRPRANGRDPMLGAVPGVDGLFAATGGFKISFGIAEKAARHVIEEVIDGATDLPETFRVRAHVGRGP